GGNYSLFPGVKATVFREMPNSRQSSAMGSAAKRRATNCSLSSITEHSFRHHFLPKKGKSVTYVSGTNCYPCVRSVTDTCDSEFPNPATVGNLVAVRSSENQQPDLRSSPMGSKNDL